MASVACDTLCPVMVSFHHELGECGACLVGGLGLRSQDDTENDGRPYQNGSADRPTDDPQGVVAVSHRLLVFGKVERLHQR